jgi:hypothetical protein
VGTDQVAETDARANRRGGCQDSGDDESLRPPTSVVAPPAPARPFRAQFQDVDRHLIDPQILFFLVAPRHPSPPPRPDRQHAGDGAGSGVGINRQPRIAEEAVGQSQQHLSTLFVGGIVGC